MIAPPPRLRPRQLLLLALALWAGWLSLESLWRPPGAEPPPVLPAQLQLDGITYRRLSGTAAPSLRPLPEGLTVLAAADYAAEASSRKLALRWITLGSSSGRGVRFPIDTLPSLVLGPGASGGCQLDGRLLRSEAAVMRALSTRDPRGLDRLAWLAGLRPYRSNACLWVGAHQSSRSSGERMTTNQQRNQ
jgi:hypothetical protein